MDRLKRDNPSEVELGINFESANLIGCPSVNSEYFNMLLSDPPMDSVEMELTFVHSLDPGRVIKVRRIVLEVDSPLTFRSLMDSARQKLGELIVHEPGSSSNDWKPYHYMVSKESVGDMISQKIQEHGGQFILDCEKSQLFFPGVIVPSEQEWLDMDAKRAKLVSTSQA